MSGDEANPARDRRAFARLVKESATEQLRELMRGEQGLPVLEEIFTHMPEAFRPDRAGALRAVVHWRVVGGPDGVANTFELVIADRACTRSPRPQREPNLVLTIDGVDFIRVATGNASPLMMFMRGRMKAKGDLGLTAKLPQLFDPATALAAG